jgi:hypothetical protein
VVGFVIFMRKAHLIVIQVCLRVQSEDEADSQLWELLRREKLGGEEATIISSEAMMAPQVKTVVRTSVERDGELLDTTEHLANRQLTGSMAKTVSGTAGEELWEEVTTTTTTTTTTVTTVTTTRRRQARAS